MDLFPEAHAPRVGFRAELLPERPFEPLVLPQRLRSSPGERIEVHEADVRLLVGRLLQEYTPQSLDRSPVLLSRLYSDLVAVFGQQLSRVQLYRRPVRCRLPAAASRQHGFLECLDVDPQLSAWTQQDLFVP